MHKPGSMEEWEALRQECKAQLEEQQQRYTWAQSKRSRLALSTLYDPASLILYSRACEEEDLILRQIKRLGTALHELDAVMRPGWAGKQPREEVV